MNDYLDTFNQHRPKLMAIAYRMLDSRSDAEDVLQDTYIRWLRPHPSDLRSHEAWLATVVTRLCIDRLRTAKKEHENYVGQWIPQPWISAMGIGIYSIG